MFVVFSRGSGLIVDENTQKYRIHKCLMQILKQTLVRSFSSDITNTATHTQNKRAAVMKRKAGLRSDVAVITQQRCDGPGATALRLDSI